MNTDKPQLMIVEEDNEFIQIWKDYFSQRFKINFIKNNSNLIVDNKNKIIVFNANLNIKLIKKYKNNIIFIIINSKAEANKEKFEIFDNKFFVERPINLYKLEKKTLEALKTSVFQENEKIKLKHFYLFPFEKKITCFYQKISINLTEKEVSMLIALNKKRKTVSRIKLLEKVWGYNSSIKTTTVETHIHRLRKKLCAFYQPKLEIKTDKNGYIII
jgi:DNA-binding response OmpR family regulator